MKYRWRRSQPDPSLQPALFTEAELAPGAAPDRAPVAPPAATEIDPPIRLVRSHRRQKTYKWSLLRGEVHLEIPAGLREDDEARILAEVAEQARQRLERAGRASDAALFSLARELAHRYLPAALPGLQSVAWSDRQGRRWGSCTTGTGAIRLSSRLHTMPDYVLEAVLVHELAHLLEPNHSERFQALAGAYPFAERAKGFLEAVDRQFHGASAEWDDDPE